MLLFWFCGLVAQYKYWLTLSNLVVVLDIYSIPWHFCLYWINCASTAICDIVGWITLYHTHDSTMSSEDNITLASNVLGTIGTVLWCIQLIPQIWYNWRRKNTEGFPAAMMFLWASCKFVSISSFRGVWGLRLSFESLDIQEYSPRRGKGKEEKEQKASRLKLGLLIIVIHAGSVPMGAYLILQVSWIALMSGLIA